MSNFTHDTAAFVLPVTASVAALAAAFTAFTGRRTAAVTARSQATDLMGTTVWFGGSVKRIPTGTAYVPQSRGSSG